MKKILLIIVFFSYVLAAKAGWRDSSYNYLNSVKIFTGDFYIKERTGRVKVPFRMGVSESFVSDLYGISYQRQVNSFWHMGVQYSFWRRGEYPLTLTDITLVDRDGILCARRSYHMLDIYALHKYFYKKHHCFNLSLGPSITFGQDGYSHNYYLNPEPPQDDRMEVVYRRRSYWGFVPSAGYEYQFWKRRLSIGIDAKARFYNNGWPGQYDIVFHTGVNF
jgi:hypothetical protein